MSAAGGPVVVLAGGTGGAKALFDAIRAYETQFPPAKQRVVQAVESMDRYHGHTAGFEAGELFLTYRSIGVDDLVAWSCPTVASGPSPSRSSSG